MTDGNRSRTETTDLLNHTVAEQSGGNSLTQYTYDAAGRVTQTVLPDGEKQITSYENETLITGVDLNGDGVLTADIDRMEKSESVFEPGWPEDKGSWKTVTSRAWRGSWQAVSLTWMTEDGTKARSQTPGTDGYAMQENPPVSAQGNSHTVRATKPDGQVQETAYTMNDGYVTAMTSTWKDASGQIMTTGSQTQDVWGNVLTWTDGRTGTTTYIYDEGTGALLSQTMPDQSITSCQYDDYGRRVTTVLPDGTQQHVTYDTEGKIMRQWGSQQYPVSYEYDAYGHKTGMTTYRIPVGNAVAWPEGAEGDKTTWSYDNATGNLLQKTYADGKGVSYTYTPGGKVNTQTNARGNVTTYAYNSAGQSVKAQVNDDGVTPTKTYSYDQNNRIISSTTEGVASYQYIYNDQDQVMEEQITIPTVNGNLERSLIRSYDSHGRPIGYQLKNGDIVEQSLSYTYTPAGQLAGVTADGKEFTYTYLPNRPKIIVQMTSPLHTVSHVYEANRDVLTSKNNRWKNKVDSPVISAYIYAVNNLGQRVSVSTEGEAFEANPANWAWEYDALGQVSRKTGNRDYDYQFSTKPSDSLTGLLHYNYRHYNPRDGRWLNREPFPKQGMLNLYIFLNNRAQNHIDFLGLDFWIENTKRASGFHHRICVTHWDGPSDEKPSDGETCCIKKKWYKKQGKFCVSFAPDGGSSSSSSSGDNQNAEIPNPSPFPPGLDGPDPAGNGVVYEDNQDPATKEQERETSCCQEDIKIEAYLKGLVGQRANYALLWQNCRKFSKKSFDYAKENLKGECK